MRTAERKRLIEIQRNPNVMVTDIDKNLGPAAIDTATYIRRALQDHLLNTLNYQPLTFQEAEHLLDKVFLEAQTLLGKIVDNQQDAASLRTYFDRAYHQQDKDVSRMESGRPQTLSVSTFYILPKVHKTPWKTRPVASQRGSIHEPIARWLDYMLQQVLPLCHSYLNNGEELQTLLFNLDTVPKDATIFSVDATAMYCNIDTG